MPVQYTVEEIAHDIAVNAVQGHLVTGKFSVCLCHVRYKLLGGHWCHSYDHWFLWN